LFFEKNYLFEKISTFFIISVKAAKVLTTVPNNKFTLFTPFTPPVPVLEKRENRPTLD
jgi:cyanate permease